jgi:hypothetical protein
VSRSLEIVRVGLSLVVRLSPATADARLAWSPEALGESLAGQVHGYARERGLCYYPPLDYFVDTTVGVDTDLLAITDEVARFACGVARDTLRRRLRGVFSTVQLRQIHCTAYTMPRVRYSDPNALHKLAEHYRPDGVKADLVATLLERRATEVVEQLAAQKARHWLEDGFASVRVLSARLLGGRSES